MQLEQMFGFVFSSLGLVVPIALFISSRLGKKLDTIEKLVTAERLDHAVLTNRILVLEQEVTQIKEVLKSEAELKLLIKENNEK